MDRQLKVLVCGSEGSLMQATIPKLLQLGYKVYGVDNLAKNGKRGDERGYEFARIDLNDPLAVDLAFAQAQPDFVIQAAARIYGVGGFHAYGADILGQDISLHNNVLRASVDYNVKRVVYISSSMVYETATNSELRETDVENSIIPRTGYGLSKLVGERLSKEFRKMYNIDYTIWRPFNIITSTEKAGEIGVSHVFADFISNIITKKMNPLNIIGNGEQIRCFTWIDEVAEAIAQHSFSDATRNETFNLGRHEPITMKELANLIHLEAVDMGLVTPGTLEFKTVLDFSDDVHRRVPDTMKAKIFLGWEAQVPITESVHRCLLAYKDVMTIEPQEYVTRTSKIIRV